MANTPLTPGINVVINRKVGSTNTPIYPYTRIENVFATDGTPLDDLIEGIGSHNFVPELEEGTPDGRRFLAPNNTWVSIPAASTSASGIVQLSDSTTTTDSTTAATSTAVKAAKDAADAASAALANYVLLSQLGTNGDATQSTKVATLADGKVPAAQLPSYVDDVIEGYLYDGNFYLTKSGEPAEYSDMVTPETGKIYIDIDTRKTYRYAGSSTGYVEISESLALGETSSTAFAGDRGVAVESKLSGVSSGANKTEASDNNGYIKIDNTETLVYTHPIASGFDATNPHGITKSTIGLGNVENKSAATIISEIDKVTLDSKIGLASASQNGLMSIADYKKLQNCMEVAINSSEPTFSGADNTGLWFEIKSTDPTV